MPLDQIVGPFALTIAAVAAAVALWREHLKADQDDRTQRDRALDGWEAQTDATERLAASVRDMAQAVRDLSRTK